MSEYYLTEEDIKIAASNGIHERLARFRFEQMAWDKERAITQPVRTWNGHWAKWKEVAKEHGVKQSTFYARVNVSKWTPEQAATTPPDKPGGKIMRKKRKIPEELIALAEANGINKNTLYSRILQYNFDYERAATEPVSKGRRRKSNFNKPIEKRKIQ